MIEVTLTLEVVQLPNARPYWCLRFDGGEPVRSTLVTPITDADLAPLSDLDPAARSWAGVVTHLTPRADWSFNAETLRQVGSLLWDRLFEAGPAIRDALHRVEARARLEGRPIRYVLALLADDESSARMLELLPLELTAARKPGSARREFFFKRPGYPAVRCAPESSSYALDLSGNVRMLVATAHDDTEPRPTAEELAEHATAITTAAEKIPGWSVDRLPDATPDELRARVEGGRYDVLYIACHGLEARDDAGVLSLRGGLVRGHDLAGWLSIACNKRGAPVKLVILCACSSAASRRGQQTDGMAQWITRGTAPGEERALAAIGFRGPVQITWAFSFMERLSAELAAGRDLDAAFALTRAAQADGDAQWALPLLYRRLSDPGAMQVAVTRHAAAGGLESLGSPGLTGLLPPRSARAYFVAREAELDALTRWMQQPGAAVISAVEGEGGIGKTELALKVAELAQADGRPVLWLERADTNLRGAMLALARTADPSWRPSPEASLDDLRAHMRQVLAPYAGLVVLDDLADDSAVDALTPSNAWNVLVTTRREHLVSGATPLKLSSLDGSAGLRLLAEVAWRSKEVPADEHAAAAELVAALGGLPLAIEMAGAAMWQRGQSAAEWLTDFQGRVGEVADERTRVEAVLLRSLDGVGVEAREALDVLSLAAPAGLDADQVATGLRRSPVAARRHLDALARVHLARWSPATGRYTLHPLVREAMRRRMQDDGARWDTARAAMGRVVAGIRTWIVRALSQDTGEALSRWAQARQQIEGLRLADWSPGAPGAVEVGVAFGTLDQFRQLDSAPTERLGVFDAVAALVTGAGPEAEGRVLHARGKLRHFRADLDGAEKDYDNALMLFDEAQSRLGQANVLLARGELRRFRDDLDGAEKDYDRALRLFGEAQDRLGQANVLLARGELRRRRDDLVGAGEDYGRALSLYDEVQDRIGQANVLHARGELRRRSNDLNGAEEDYDHALGHFVEAQDRLGQANVLLARGDLAQTRQQWDVAMSWYTQALSIYEDAKDRVGASNVHAELAKVYASTARFDEARTAATNAAAIGAQCQNRYAMDVAAKVLARLDAGPR